MKRTKFIAGLLACFFSIGLVQAQKNKNYGKSAARKLQIAEFAIANLYVDSVDERKLVEDAIVGMLKNLDPHSTYSNPEEVKKMNEPLSENGIFSLKPRRNATRNCLRNGRRFRWCAEFAQTLFVLGTHRK